MKNTRPFSCFVIAVFCLAYIVNAATVTDLIARYSKGQVFITFQEIPDSGVTYDVYKSDNPITEISGLSPIAVLAQNSGTNLYTSARFVVTDTGTPLPAGYGLLVYTCNTDGPYYYAVTNSLDSSITAGVNTLSQPVQETRLDVPGAVQIGPVTVNGEGASVTPYFAWEDYTTWDHTKGYYGNRFNVVSERLPLDTTKMYPLTLKVHGAGTNGYAEPGTYVGVPNGVYIIPRDFCYVYGLLDPYTQSGRFYSGWFGYSTNGLAINYTERRCVRYINLVKAELKFRIDTTRVYVTGGSMGGGGSMHIAYHNPQVFAAAAPSIGWVNPHMWASGNWSGMFGAPGDSMRVNSTGGPAWWNWQDMTWVVNTEPELLPPIIHTFRKDDNTVSPADYPELLQQTEEKKYFHVSRWMNGGHSEFYYTTGQCAYFRFRKNEAYPAFSNASNSDSFSIQEGQRNFYLDWSSSLHDLLPSDAQDNVIDSADIFKMSFKSLSGADASADVTIRNAQHFKAPANALVHWRNLDQQSLAHIDSGTVTADANGLVTVPQLSITTAGSRLILTPDGWSNIGMVNKLREKPGMPCLSVSPNPFNPTTTISIGQVHGPALNAGIYNISGRHLTNLVMRDGFAIWNATAFSSGVYIIKVVTSSGVLTKQMILLR
ncbi:MAG: hypothetical protein A2268_07900 [Candidatus Raymondbacteria bacterium RifOxyA12_full_50_37]|uniref:Secretion system C-terminal sorting domain-containing protein n=1 Tax=Candidatus Raymondbacteria bacterium RIFOXYD12_FULL_49_13 TaxID=1817890 RepID=A0A1F7F803_UNCRA|nr:MAG: hypothetical protein A2268_07900 [Candidatus Raymondbacteria bacterium RifOxyA12_full_50_37]OGJ89629.1 MAG: hypothetical protein A2248_09620 [Candidatus Raymondbacteria bacterium RIFOXYA2_FULL_49_16]OGK01086.1 MAG: hypothetical protein A2350_13430 [Candidatus Raymondbacteria bacterium RifOxyB12_full_50_8]OGK02647.1 MAG: hypothetical protein A2519_11340 [Candidatus Raymondbacteria bacterium RIFOXYD12_FULL_49_13]OGP42885.1 MAG: hypothetical protein A2324_02035 [Candidatus Raymondbacteria 